MSTSAGYNGTTLDDIAAELGVTKPFIYTHFRSKVELLAALCRPTMIVAGGDRERGGRRRHADRTADRAIIDFTHVILSRQPNIAIYFREEKNCRRRRSRTSTPCARSSTRCCRSCCGGRGGERVRGRRYRSHVARDRRHDQLGVHLASAERPAGAGGDVQEHGGSDAAHGGRAAVGRRAGRVGPPSSAAPAIAPQPRLSPTRGHPPPALRHPQSCAASAVIRGTRIIRGTRRHPRA